ncbi:MAG: DUF2141 domain-containing protein [Desulfuromonadales bacterium]|nr:MAG: DUF2141 domain-containing protein [Desulfuromonadales bacterium]
MHRLVLSVIMVFTLVLLCRKAADAGSLSVTVSGLRGTKGFLSVTVWRSEADFLKDVRLSAARKVLPVTGPEMAVIFENLPAGVYAVSSFQDENGNGAIDRSFIGVPTEPSGVSQGARGVMGPPRFRDAAFELKGSSQNIPIRLR